MVKYKGIIYLLLLLFSLLLLAIDHRGVAFGHSIFRMFGIPPWTDGDNSGLHTSAVCGIILMIVSGRRAILHFRKSYSEAGRVIVILCIAFFLVFPYISRGVMELVHINQSGITTLDLSKKDSSCRYNTDNNTVLFDCELTLINYGNEGEQVSLRPLFNEKHSGILSSLIINYEDIHITPRSSSRYYLQFKSNIDNEMSTSGMNEVGGIQVMNGDQERKIVVD